MSKVHSFPTRNVQSSCTCTIYIYFTLHYLFFSSLFPAPAKAQGCQFCIVSWQLRSVFKSAEICTGLSQSLNGISDTGHHTISASRSPAWSNTIECTEYFGRSRRLTLQAYNFESSIKTGRIHFGEGGRVITTEAPDPELLCYIAECRRSELPSQKGQTRRYGQQPANPSRCRSSFGALQRASSFPSLPNRFQSSTSLSYDTIIDSNLCNRW